APLSAQIDTLSLHDALPISQPFACDKALKYSRSSDAVVVFKEKAGLFECALFAGGCKVQHHIRARQDTRHEVHAVHYMFIALQHTKTLSLVGARCGENVFLKKPRPRTANVRGLFCGVVCRGTGYSAGTSCRFAGS